MLKEKNCKELFFWNCFVSKTATLKKTKIHFTLPRPCLDTQTSYLQLLEPEYLWSQNPGHRDCLCFPCIFLQQTVRSMARRNKYFAPKIKVPSYENNIRSQIFIKCSLYQYVSSYARACNGFVRPISVCVIVPVQHSCLRKIAAVASRWQHCVQFDRSENKVSELTLQKRIRYRSTNWHVKNIIKCWKSIYCKYQTKLGLQSSHRYW